MSVQQNNTTVLGPDYLSYKPLQHTSAQLKYRFIGAQNNKDLPNSPCWILGEC